MAGITRLHEAIKLLRSGPAVVFGPVFHSTYHLFEESEGGIRHYGRADESDVDDFEKFLEQGGGCAYVFTEFPSNPILVSVDLMRLRRLVCFLTLPFVLLATPHMHDQTGTGGGGEKRSTDAHHRPINTTSSL